MKTWDRLELNDSVSMTEKVTDKVRTVGVRGLDVEKAKELGLFNRISLLLCAMYTAVRAADRIYGGIDNLLQMFGGKRNEIKRACMRYEESAEKFISFWKDYYAYDGALVEMNRDAEKLYHMLMYWCQLPEAWQLGDPLRLSDDSSAAIVIDNDDTLLRFHQTVADSELVEEKSLTWCVTRYDIRTNTQETVETGMDKPSAMMVAKRMSDDDLDDNHIYTASMIREYVERRVEVTPYKAYRRNQTVGSITHQLKGRTT